MISPGLTAEKQPEDGIVLWEAHRGGGGGHEMPESCPLSFEYGWMLGGRPEADVNMTADGEIVSIHDATLDRTAVSLPPYLKGKPVSELTLEEIRSVDIGWKEYPHQKVPTIRELFERLKMDSSRQMIIDYKRVDLNLLVSLIRSAGVAKQLTFASCEETKCAEIRAMLPDIRIKRWIGGAHEIILEQFRSLASRGFCGFDEVQIHLNEQGRACGAWRYQVRPSELSDMQRITKQHGVLLQVLPWKFERDDLFAVLDLGIRSFAVDYPNKFCKICAEYFAGKWGRE